MGGRFVTTRPIVAGATVLVVALLSPLDRASADEPRMATERGGTAARTEDGPRRAPSYSRASYDWPHAMGPFYGRETEKERGKRRAPGLLLTRVGTFDLTAGRPGIPEALTSRNQLDVLGAQYFVVQLDPSQVKTGALDQVRGIIEDNGGAIARAMPVMALISRLTPEALERVESTTGVITVEPYHAAFKLDPTIGRTPLTDPIKAVSEVYDLDVRIFPGEDAAVVGQELAKLGGNVRAVFPDTVRVEIHRSKLADVAALQPVEFVHEHVEFGPHAEETTTTVQTGKYNLGAVPYHDAGIDGGGGGIAPGPQVLMILDSGIQIDAGDLAHSRTSAGTPGPTHRKVRRYESTEAFGGSGDTLGCDAGPSSGFTHGHLVAATALGNATAVDLVSYGPAWHVTDALGNPWRLDGVAPGAVLVAFDGQPTPLATSCQDPLQDNIYPGDLYSGGATGSLGDSYTLDGARIFNLSWGAPINTYTTEAMDIDQFLLDKQDALVFVSAGNSGEDSNNDGVPDPGSLGAPATTKNGLSIGASRAPVDLADPMSESDVIRSSPNWWASRSFRGGDTLEEEERAVFSSTGPTATGNRVAPQLMAPGDEYGGGTMGLSSEFACRTSDNDQLDPVECDVVSGKEGTSHASAAAAGAGLLVRDYFAQGFYPDGSASNPGNAADLVADVSGPLVKAVLIASAKFLTGDMPPAFSGASPGGDNLSITHRFNNEQGYGRVKLDNALPLQSWPVSVSGLLVTDGAIDGEAGDIPGLGGSVDVVTQQVETGTFEICDGNEELRVALAWFDDAGAALINDLDLEIEAPDGTRFRGNYFTDDDDRDGAIDITTEDCPDPDGTTGTVSSSQWALPVCMRGDGTFSPHDRENPTEAIVLSPDPLGDGSTNPIAQGTWTIRIKGAGGTNSSQRYAVVVAGGVCGDSWVRLDAERYTCSGSAVVTVTESAAPGDIDPSASDVSARTTVQVLQGTTVVDEESGLGFTRSGSRYVAESLVVTSGTAADPGNGALDVRDGDTIRVVYADVGPDGTTPDPEKRRIAEAVADCSTNIAFGELVFEQFGADAEYRVGGGCERNARGQFEFGYPDRYLDAGERVSVSFAFASHEQAELAHAEVDLRCVLPDADSPADCPPHSAACADPDRSNNPSCDQRPSGQPGDQQYMTILDTPKTIGRIPAGSAQGVGFSIQVADTIPGTPEVELVLAVNGATLGKTAAGLVVSRQRLDVDEQSLFYSTDFPTGGTEYVDVQNDEILQNPTTDLTWPHRDYRFETRMWSDLTSGGTKNQSLQSPWNFDTNDGGFRSGILATTDFASIPDVISQWGEDLNFNGINDKEKRCTNGLRRLCSEDTDCSPGGECLPIEDRDPADGQLNKSWNTRGGCGWQTKAPNTCNGNPTVSCFEDSDCGPYAPCDGPAPKTGGIWHTGRIGSTSSTACLADGSTPGRCRGYATVGGSTGLRVWREALVTPVMQKVNGEEYEVEILQWAWNQALDLADSNVAFAWELDTDTETLEPVDLFSDSTALNFLFGGYGARNAGNDPKLTNGYSMFAPLDATMTASVNGSDAAGNNRQGQNSCFFEGANIGVVVCPDCPNHPGDLGWAGPLDNDIDDDSDGTIDEYVTTNGPIRNMDISAVNGPDMRFDLLEDLYGETGDTFQAALMLWNFEAVPYQEPLATSYGVGVDDMVVQWREFSLAQDDTDCASGECAVVQLETNNLFSGRTLLGITVLERSPDPANDCDLDGLPDATVDCDGDGYRDVVVRVSSEAEPDGEIVFLNARTDPAQFEGELPVSSVFDGAGILFVAPGTRINPRFFPPQETLTERLVTAIYLDPDDGTGAPCRNHVDPALHGQVQANATVFLETGEVIVWSTSLTDNGDNDGFADTNETVELRLRVRNPGDVDLTGLTAHLTTDDPKIDCVLRSSVAIGELAAGAEVLGPEGFVFRVADVDRTASGLTNLDDFSAEFEVVFAADQFDVNERPQTVTLDLDLDASGGGAPTTFFEGFESGTFGTFTTMNLDAGRNSFAGSDGYRCQYSDPDWVGSMSYGYINDCYLGASASQADAYYWQVHTTAAVDGGKAYSGSNSLYMGIFGPEADEHTTPLALLEAIRTIDPINLDHRGQSSELSLKQQVDFIDSKTMGAPFYSAPDRGTVALQLADLDDQPVGYWVKLEPYLNVYDQQGVDNYFNCTFDPVDDGNTEDDFFDPTDPHRRLGPSSTCMPEFNFVHQGDTFRPFEEGNIGRASHGPGLPGSLGIGTWVESRFQLERFRGRRVRLRFLNTSLKAGMFETWESIFTFNPSPGDDGWWIDDVRVTNALTEPVVLTNDDKPNLGLPGCGNVCNEVTAALAKEPDAVLSAPGRVVELSAIETVADRCLDGMLQFRFWIDDDGDGSGGGLADTMLRGWNDVPEIVLAPVETTSYVVEARCSSDPACAGTAIRTVFVDCPASGAFTFEIFGLNRDTFGWDEATPYDYSSGPLDQLSTYTTNASGQNAGPAATFDIAGDQPAAGEGLWYLFRESGPLGAGDTGFCNAPGNTWGNGSRDSALP